MGTVLLRIHEATAMAWHAMALMAAHAGTTLSTRRMAAALGASGAHLAKVLQQMGKAGLVRSSRGRRGGFRLARPASEITMLEIYEAIEGPMNPASCLADAPICDGDHCILGDLLGTVNRHVSTYLSQTSLAHIASSVYLEKVNQPHGGSPHTNAAKVPAFWPNGATD